MRTGILSMFMTVVGTFGRFALAHMVLAFEVMPLNRSLNCNGTTPSLEPTYASIRIRRVWYFNSDLMCT